MSVETGHLRLRPGARGWTADYARPQWSALLVGQALEEAELRVGRLHGLCGMAHRVALARAAEGAGPIADARAAARELLLNVEQVEAMARRMALDFTRALRLAPAPGIAAPVLKAAERTRSAIGLASARGPLAPAPTLRAACADLLEAFRAAVDRCPAVSPEQLATAGQKLAPLVKHAWAAPSRLLEELEVAVADLVPRVRPLATERRLVEGAGEANAQTYRGLLAYEVAVVSGHVRRVAWTTPTDRRFGAGGTARAVLAEIDARTPSSADFKLAMCALDPCVPWSAEACVDA